LQLRTECREWITSRLAQPVQRPAIQSRRDFRTIAPNIGQSGSDRVVASATRG
jgi:hypothetical protein